MSKHGIAVAYLRVSTRDQALGLSVQREALEAWASSEGVTIAAWCVDEGVSGGAELDKRPGLLAALEAVKANKASLLLVHKRDRLARDVGIALAVEKTLGRMKAAIHSVDGTGNGDSPADELMRTMLTAMGSYERSLIRGRIKAALATKKARGQRVGQVPYGYQLAADGVQLVDQEAEQEVIRCVRELREAGLSFRRIVEELATLGLVSRVGNPFGKTQVIRMAA